MYYAITIPFFFGPRQMIASSWLPRRNPIDINDKLSSTYTGDQPDPDWWICSFKTPNMRGCDGPQISMSKTAKFLSGYFNAMVRANIDVTVLLPTPPLPDTTSSLFFTSASRSFTSSMAGSGPFVAPVAHRFWFGQPAHADDLPAASLCVPGQCSAAFSGISDMMDALERNRSDKQQKHKWCVCFSIYLIYDCARYLSSSGQTAKNCHPAWSAVVLRIVSCRIWVWAAKETICQLWMCIVFDVVLFLHSIDFSLVFIFILSSFLWIDRIICEKWNDFVCISMNIRHLRTLLRLKVNYFANTLILRIVRQKSCNRPMPAL